MNAFKRWLWNNGRPVYTFGLGFISGAYTVAAEPLNAAHMLILAVCIFGWLAAWTIVSLWSAGHTEGG
jgi:hypothetical protein